MSNLLFVTRFMRVKKLYANTAGIALVTIPMAGGKGSVALPRPDSHVVFDPDARILRENAAITAWQTQQEAEEAKKKAEAAAKK